MLANGFNLETIKALTEAMGGKVELGDGGDDMGGVGADNPPPAHSQAIGVETKFNVEPPVITSASSTVASLHSGITSITSLQHPIPKKLLAGVEPIMSTTSLPPGVLSSVQDTKPFQHELQTHRRQVIFTSKEECMLLDDVKDPLLTQPGGLSHQLHGKIVTFNGQHHLITTSNKPMPSLRRISETQNVMTPLGTLDLRVGKRGDDSISHQYLVNSSHLAPDNTVLKVLDQSALVKGKRGSSEAPGGGPPKVKRQRLKDENGNGTYMNRKTTSLGALGQALHGKS
jgi:hypothetical protein